MVANQRIEMRASVAGQPSSCPLYPETEGDGTGHEHLCHQLGAGPKVHEIVGPADSRHDRAGQESPGDLRVDRDEEQDGREKAELDRDSAEQRDGAVVPPIGARASDGAQATRDQFHDRSQRSADEHRRHEDGHAGSQGHHIAGPL